MPVLNKGNKGSCPEKRVHDNHINKNNTSCAILKFSIAFLQLGRSPLLEDENRESRLSALCETIFNFSKPQILDNVPLLNLLGCRSTIISLRAPLI